MRSCDSPRIADASSLAPSAQMSFPLPPCATSLPDNAQSQAARNLKCTTAPISVGVCSRTPVSVE